ncbi:hypothetical protein PISL3812_09607 [Talaromyces islandicus]|uniref:Uncharacterized protein n=1 Tax=Talaromyces islandicus TaxID=28573 RepID=A0A0U1MC74_TALIS|nr:hypothetical protein PISL3812_09607 [Talaromyces islandicus]
MVADGGCEFVEVVVEGPEPAMTSKRSNTTVNVSADNRAISSNVRGNGDYEDCDDGEAEKMAIIGAEAYRDSHSQATTCGVQVLEDTDGSWQAPDRTATAL